MHAPVVMIELTEPPCSTAGNWARVCNYTILRAPIREREMLAEDRDDGILIRLPATLTAGGRVEIRRTTLGTVNRYELV